jgi:hypothetical protein
MVGNKKKTATDPAALLLCGSATIFVGTMVQITIKTPNPKCRLYWCLIEFIEWRYNQSCWYFRPLLRTSSLVHPPPPLHCVKKYLFIQCVIGGGDRVLLRAYGMQELYTVYLTKFRTYKIALISQTKT